MSFVDSFVVFPCVALYVASHLRSAYHVFSINIFVLNLTICVLIQWPPEISSNNSDGYVVSYYYMI